jgi:bifunctional non-homologous end joining protein LigD
MLPTRPKPPKSAFIEPCQPIPADRPPIGPDWIHEIKHDGYRLMARRDPVGIRLISRNGHDWSARYPLIVEAVNALRCRSCLVDGEAVWCDPDGVESTTPLQAGVLDPSAFPADVREHYLQAPGEGSIPALPHM